MPSLGADMEFGTVLEWLVKPGDPVKRGDIVAVVDTSKAEIDVEIFEDGVIGELLVPERSRVPVGTVLATLLTAAGGATAATPPTQRPAAPAAVEPPAAPPRPTVPPVVAPAPPVPIGHHRARVSPVARRAAEQLGVDLAEVTGTGPDGAITKIDVERFAGGLAALPPTPPSAPPTTPASGAEPAPAAQSADRQLAMRQAIGALMARSKREIPHYYLETEIDMSRALAWLHEENLTRPVVARLLPAVLLMRAVAGAVAELPAFNGFWLDGGFHPADGVHLGVAIALRGGGLIAPALHDADRMSLDELMVGLRDLVQRARSGRLRSSEMSDPTITVTNLGEQGVDLVHGVIYPPQVALVGFGVIRERPWAENGMIGIRATVRATLAGDHRASDGHAGGRLLALVSRRLQNPEGQ